ncbi:MAG: rhomboid family intramembrane serine protease [Haliscomenobacter sp.]|nr:rhomboid family intramembrane serine protease [Haliscomenobacter sp.]MBK8880423.1 rhomboid family intramembrane serine protease [Haliscomenobacter sp.]
MFQSIWDDVKREFSHGNMVSRLIIVNSGFFVAIHIVRLVLFLANGAKPDPLFYTIVEYLSINASGWLVLTRPWTVFSHMFLHVDFLHILANMLYLYWFGRIVGDFIGNQRILPMYLMGGLAGALIYFLSANFLGFKGHYALGASAAVMAIVTAAGAIAPDYIMRLLFIGDVKLKYIVAVLIFLDLISIANSSNTGGHLAHLGGALFGFLYIFQLQRGNDWTQPVNSLFTRVGDWWSYHIVGNEKKRPRPKVVYRSPQAATKAKSSAASAKGSAASDPNPLSYQEQLDSILDKIKVSGYESLTSEEKEFLFNASKR